MHVNIEQGWNDALRDEFDAPYFADIVQKVKNEYNAPGAQVFPPAALIFNAFNLSAFNQTKVVIVGQDPYHGPGQANGLCFSVNPGIKFPPSLMNIFKEVHDDTGAPIPQDGNLERWAKQGVLLLNSSLSVRAHSPKSHDYIGWSRFTDAVIATISKKADHVVFILWGSDAIRKSAIIDARKHLILTSPHPSPLSAYRGFFGNHHFSKTNEFLIANNKKPIKW